MAWADPKGGRPTTDFILLVSALVETVLIGMGTLVGYRIARMAGHAPIGWILLDVSFAIGLLRNLLYLHQQLYQPVAQDAETYIANLLTLPIVLFIFTGVVFMYRDFRKQLTERQAVMLAE